MIKYIKKKKEYMVTCIDSIKIVILKEYPPKIYPYRNLKAFRI